jgi:hypothetical protein
MDGLSYNDTSEWAGEPTQVNMKKS